ncbi:MAG: hypothetical protein GY874_06665 [Desulfobacteraceae bacterium]|nr:hypothetical protein [Desulfobacteraceae bacterium]
MGKSCFSVCPVFPSVAHYVKLPGVVKVTFFLALLTALPLVALKGNTKKKEKCKACPEMKSFGVNAQGCCRLKALVMQDERAARKALKYIGVLSKVNQRKTKEHM